ncbi:MAG: FAD-dependent oxidoreductase, partial [Victivallales bacterium]|nr:FAD-dependent oxidoreductase [Victivallales bacterium]
NGKELSDAELEGRKQLRQYFDFLRSEIPIFEHCRVHSIATQIGIRESRRIRGNAYLTREDFTNASKFEDAIARVHYPIDIHSPTGAGTEITTLEPGEWYDIPYGCIVPSKINNLLMGCRAVSLDHAIHSSMRVMPPVVSIGQAAGVAADFALKSGVTPKMLDGIELKRRLIERGRNLI